MVWRTGGWLQYSAFDISPTTDSAVCDATVIVVYASGLSKSISTKVFIRIIAPVLCSSPFVRNGSISLIACDRINLWVECHSSFKKPHEADSTFWISEGSLSAHAIPEVEIAMNRRIFFIFLSVTESPRIWLVREFGSSCAKSKTGSL